MPPAETRQCPGAGCPPHLTFSRAQLQNPFDHLYRDHDVEGMSDGYDPPTAYGHIDGIDDPTMGWARYAQVQNRPRDASELVLQLETSRRVAFGPSSGVSIKFPLPAPTHCRPCQLLRSAFHLCGCSQSWIRQQMVRELFECQSAAGGVVVDACNRISGVPLLPQQDGGVADVLQATRHLNLNSGLFYIQANERTVSLMSRIAARLAREKAWDQSVFNEEIFFLSHDDYVSPNISVRVMNIFKFLNSKVRQLSLQNFLYFDRKRATQRGELLRCCLLCMALIRSTFIC